MIVDLGVPRSSRGSGTIKIKGLTKERNGTLGPFYNFTPAVLQSSLLFVLHSSRLARRLPLQDGSRRKLLLVHLPRIMRDHGP